MMSPRKNRATLVRNDDNLSAEAHRQVMELLGLADKSKNRDIRLAAIKIAKDRGSRPSATLIMVSGTVIVVAAASAGWYALVHYPGNLGWEITIVVFSAVLIIIALYALLSGNLSQANFLQIIEMVWARFRNSAPCPPSKDIASLHAQETVGTEDGTNDSSS